MTYRENLTLWSKRHPDEALAVDQLENPLWDFCETGPLNEQNLKREVEGEVQYIHSSDNIASEVRQWFDFYDFSHVPTIVVYGVGLGNYYDVLKGRLQSNSLHHLIFFEEDKGVFHRFLETERAQALLTDPQVDLFCPVDEPSR